MLRVGFTAAWNGNLLLRAVDEFKAHHPGSPVEVYEETYHTGFEMLQTGELDLFVGEVMLLKGLTSPSGPWSSPRPALSWSPLITLWPPGNGLPGT